MPDNAAAWLRAERADLEVGPAPMPAPGAGEILVENRAVAVNVVDAVKQSTGPLMYRWLPTPAVLGEDVAGAVAAVGAGVTRFAVGDRVVGYAVGMERGRRHVAEGGFQRFTVLRAALAAPIPDTMSFERASVLPLGVSTAASAMFQSDQLGLRAPDHAAPAATTTTNEVVVIWGASTSVGSNAVQLAAAAGYRVLATASPRHHDRARALGAAAVVDYRSPTAVAELVHAAGGASVAGILAVGTGSAEPSVAVAAATGARRVTLASPSVSFDALPRRRGPSLAAARVLGRLVTGNVALQLRARRAGIRVRYVWGSSLMDNEVGPMLWERYLPLALADGRHVAAPDPVVVGEGLEQVQTAIDRLRRGVSAQKLVVRL